MPGYFALTFKDFDKELGTVGFNVPEFNDDNFDARLSAVTALRTAIEAVTRGAVAGEDLVARRSLNSDTAAPTDPDAQVETRWLISYQDNVNTRSYTLTIPTAKGLPALYKPNSVEADLTAAAWTAFETAFNAIVLSPNMNPVTFLNAVRISRDG